MPVITISRQYGSGADWIAERVCNLTGYRYLDKWLLRQVAADVGLSENEVVDFSEEHYKARSFFENLFGPRQRVVAQVSTRQRDTTGATQISVTQLDEAQCIDLVRTAVKRAHDRSNIVIMGRGSQVILRDKPDVLHVRVIAPLEDRIEWVRREENKPPAEARELVEARDRAAAQYLERFFNIDWEDQLNYQLIINTARMNKEVAARIITSAAKHLEETTEPAEAVPG